MSMSTRICGFRAPDTVWQKMKAVWDACAAAEIDPPEEVTDFFGYEAPGDSGQEVDIRSAVTEYCREMTQGWEIDLTQLPEGLTKIHVENHY